MIKTLQDILDSQAFKFVRIGQFLLALAIFTFAALMPAQYIATSAADHQLHFIGNFLLYMSASVAFLGRMKAWLLAAMLVPYTLLIELAQWLAPSRHVDINDVYANVAGLCCGYILAYLITTTWAVIKAKQSH